MFPSQFRNKWAVLAPCSSFSVLCWIRGAGWVFPGLPRQPGCVSLQRDPCVTLLGSLCTGFGTSALPPGSQGRLPPPSHHLFGIWNGSDSFLCTHRGVLHPSGGRASMASPGEGEQRRSVLPQPLGARLSQVLEELGGGTLPPLPSTSITFWMPLINHSSLSGQGEWELPPVCSLFSRALPAAFCPLNGRGAKPDGWMERWEMTSEPPLFVARFLCPLLAVCRYERSAGSAPMLFFIFIFYFLERGEAGQSWQLREQRWRFVLPTRLPRELCLWTAPVSAPQRAWLCLLTPERLRGDCWLCEEERHGSQRGFMRRPLGLAQLAARLSNDFAPLFLSCSVVKGSV